MSLEYYSKNLIKLANGKIAAEYVACITDDLIHQDWNSEPSILRKHITDTERNDAKFIDNAAKILGWWASEKHFALHYNQFAIPELNSEILPAQPDNLGHPLILDSDNQSGAKLWLIRSSIRPLPLPLT